MTENRYLPIPQQKVALHGTRVAMYIVGQEETAGESSVSVVAGVRTVTTNMDGRDVLPRLSRPFAFFYRTSHLQLHRFLPRQTWPRNTPISNS